MLNYTLSKKFMNDCLHTQTHSLQCHNSYKTFVIFKTNYNIKSFLCDLQTIIHLIRIILRNLLKVVMEENGDSTENFTIIANDQSAYIKVGPDINCGNVNTIITKDYFICLNFNKKITIVALALSNTITFVFGTFLDKICCCFPSESQKALLMVVLALIVVGVTTGGIVGRFQFLHIIC